MNANDEQDRFHSRKSPRLKRYDYTTPNYYFVTICTWEKRCLFWHGGALNKYGKIAKQGFEEIGHHFPGVVVDKFVVMPNHVHVILILEKGKTDLSVVIGQYKSFVSKQVHAFDVVCRYGSLLFTTMSFATKRTMSESGCTLRETRQDGQRTASI